MAKTFRPTLFFRVGRNINTFLLRAGVKKGNMTLLTVRGRKSGQPHTIPVALVEYDGQRWLTAPYGVVNWVRNLRVAGEATLTRGRHTERVSAFEVSAQEAAPILKRSLIGARSFVLAYFDVTADSSLAEFEREVSKHPVFLVKSLSEQPHTYKNTSERKALFS
ncbi:nitroreductase [Ktedonobacter sp. SOSP1-52]|uniref:nitroreductase family deazaflavin-dependent oxidoreductase n=1 Tax=Ktedonobacter sp. SOSP1-52 TaxID=2778366 RepID=UPI001915D944|nr:nitroreductase family deazaflavin-dependent oxidoreductase [Ktedonobacter sp. SOSP1-52]GHO69990.1 nitroreductase [Ktedonobacter sp. SOSP1-52]